MNSARSVAIAMNSAWIQSPSVTGREKRAREISGRLRPVAIPSLADMDWMSMAITLDTSTTQSNM